MSALSVSTTDLIRAGFLYIDQAVKETERLRTILENLQTTSYECTWSVDHFITGLYKATSPDSALQHITNLAEEFSHSNDPNLARRFFTLHSSELTRVIALCGVSDFLGRLLSTHPEFLPDVCDGAAVEDTFTVDFTQSFEDQVTRLRLMYWKNLFHIAADDAVSSNPLEFQPIVSQRMSNLIDSALKYALEIAQHKVPQGGLCKFAIFGMGKLGAQEINYISDVDLIYIVDKDEKFQGDLTVVGTQIASLLSRICSAVIPDVSLPQLWDIDTALRPEGKAGALVRTVESAKAYYTQWAENWEFQALLKARFIAGDEQVDSDFIHLITPLIWSASSRKNFVNDCRAMRTRVEKLIPLSQKDREIKLGKGGLRDVEFTVQMLQLVHGRTDEKLRIKNTLDALRVLAHEGYVNRQQALSLSEDYRFLRVLEHRQQLWKMKRTHLFPQISEVNEDIFVHTRKVSEQSIGQNPDIIRLSRAYGLTPIQLVERFDSVRLQVRQLHMDIYYRPMLPNISQLGIDEIRLSEEAMRARFESVGFADPDAAIRHVQSLITGVSRASRINRILLPTILLWIGQGQNPDMGLMMWRRWVETFGGSGPYLGFLRDSPTALQRLCHILSNSRYLSDALMKSSESTTWLGDDSLLQPRSVESLRTRTDAMLQRFAQSPEEFSTLLRAMRRREIERVGLGWMSSVITSQDALRAMTRVYDVLIDAALQWATHKLCTDSGVDEPLVSTAIIAMGRYGGEEVNFSSDADLMIVYEPVCDNENGAREFANKQVELLRSILSSVSGTEQKIEIDMDLRPEGKNGPLVRSVASYQEYYENWARTWERQALLRARYAAGDQSLGEKFIRDVVDPLRYDSHGVSTQEVHDIQKLKARMESERLPRGVRHDRHIKLGKGGLSDIEWTVQLFQLRFAHECYEARTPHTLEALDALSKNKYISEDDARILKNTWILCTDLRNASFLWSGRINQADIIPDDYFDIGGIAVCLGYDAHHGLQFMDDVLGHMRKSREVIDRLFYGA